MSKKNALVLSGGGAKGAYQIGALKEIERQLDIDFDVIAGVSVGAINGAMLATGQKEVLYSLWRTIKEEDIQKRKPLLGLALKYALHEVGISSNPPFSLYDNSAIKRKLKNFLRHKSLEVPFHAGRVNIDNGQYASATNPKDLDRQVLASASIPIIWDPVDLYGSKWVDGGIRNISPIGDVIGYNPDNVFVITTESYNVTRSGGTPDDIVDMATNSLGVMLKEIFNEDLKRYLEINEFVQQATDEGFALYDTKGDKMKDFNTVLIHPSASLGDALDYNPELMRQREKAGRIDTRNALEKAILDL